MVIGARLCNGECIVGQNNVSHPSSAKEVHKEHEEAPLSSPIASIHYYTEDGHMTIHQASDPVLSALCNSRVVVYAIGSLFTSIIPCLVLKGAEDQFESATFN